MILLSQQRWRRLSGNLHLLWSNLRFGCRSRRSCIRQGLYFPKFLEYPLVRQHLGQVAGKTVLDLGANYRYFTIWLATACRARVIAVDRLREPLARYHRLPSVQRHPQCLLPCATDITALPLAGAAVDLVCCISTIEHVADDAAVMREIARVLKPGGRAVLTFPCAASEFVIPNPDFTITRLYSERSAHERLIGPSGLCGETVEWWQVKDSTWDCNVGYAAGIWNSLHAYRRVANCATMGSNSLNTALLVLSKPFSS